MAVALAPLVVTNRRSSTTPRQDGYRALVRRAQAEYLEMPGLCLTFDQACRLWALDGETCSRVLEHLIAEGLVVVSVRGTYVRRTGG
ncbi:MAG: hypothetical protein AB7H88_05175 [Vicinamibacterales bacterium]